MVILVDTNVLLRLAAPKDAHHLAARRATGLLKNDGDSLVTTSQNLIETWNVATRPADRNGFGHSPLAAERLVTGLEAAFPLLTDPPDTFERWKGLAARYAVSGVQVHDARLVAVMQANGIMSILTFNARDFERYSDLGIRTLNPKEVGC